MKNPAAHNDRFALRAVGLACVRRERVLFEGLGFEVGNGGLAHVIGPNGSGKTSLLRIVCGFLQPAAGTVEWGGRPIQSLGEAFNESIAYLGHSNALKDDLSAFENLSYSARLAGLGVSRDQTLASLDRFALGPVTKTPCRFLSQGQRRRLALARLSLFASRRVWILDEPFASLDADGIDATRRLIEQHLGTGGMAILTTHQAIPISAAATQRVELAT